jgi:hypothetical protein
MITVFLCFGAHERPAEAIQPQAGQSILSLRRRLLAVRIKR